MSEITYEDDNFEDVRAPGLKILILILYVLPIPLLILVGRNFLITVFIEQANDFRWLAGAAINLLTIGFCWAAATGMYRNKKWAPWFTALGLIVVIAALVTYLVLEPEFVMLREFGTPFIGAIIGILVFSVLIVFKNREIFKK